ncbi:13711_t:CDS:1, partial [Funneliformis mosseae]
HLKIVPVERKEMSSSSTTGRVRLTPEGTVYFESLDDDGRKDFYAKLRQELADAIPIDPRRLTTNGNFETDTSTSPKQFFLSINVEQDKNKQKISVSSAIKDLDTLIKNKPYTAISNGESTSYLDQDFGYKPS